MTIIATILYLFAIILILTHEGSIDAWIWEQGSNIPSWVKMDEIYLGGRFVCICLLLVSTYFFSQGTDLFIFIKISVAGLLMGSVGWDLMFGVLRYRDALYPYSNWVTLWKHKVGFKTLGQRIFFDCYRLAFAVILLIS